jgi:hypothetical protein
MMTVEMGYGASIYVDINTPYRLEKTATQRHMVSMAFLIGVNYAESRLISLDTGSCDR